MRGLRFGTNGECPKICERRNTMTTEAKEYAAVIRWKDVADGDGISVQEYFYSEQEARAWITKQEHDPTRYKWEVMK
jgi:hypothetical protein